MTSQFLAHDPPTKEELAALNDHVAAQVGTLPSVLAPQSALLMGGSADHLLQFASDPKQSIVTLDDLHHALHELQKQPAKAIAHDYNCPVERARLLAAGAVILLQVLSRYGMEQAHVKANGIRGGLVVTYARHGDNWRQALPLPPT